MDVRPVPFRSPLSAYEDQAITVLAGHRAADSAAINLFHHKHPRFLDEKIKWRPKFIPDSEIRDAALSIEDARPWRIDAVAAKRSDPRNALRWRNTVSAMPRPKHQMISLEIVPKVT